MTERAATDFQMGRGASGVHLVVLSFLLSFPFTQVPHLYISYLEKQECEGGMKKMEKFGVLSELARTEPTHNKVPQTG